MIVKTCEQCGESFEVLYPSWAARRRTCSPRCANKLRGVNPVTTRYRGRKVDGRRKQEHRAIVEEATGAVLDWSVVVHHRNEDKTDNRLENLEVLTHQQHSALHNQKHPITKECVICGEIFTPHATKRARKQTCGKRECYSALLRQRWEERR